jgi:putative two-component system response regulator
VTILEFDHTRDTRLSDDAYEQAQSLEMRARIALDHALLDPSSADHAARVGALSLHLALRAGFTLESASSLGRAATLHDIGKEFISASVRDKPGVYTLRERLEMERHTVLGYQWLRRFSTPLTRLAAVIALNHHERWNGLGYPLKRHGHGIPVAARIVAICDAFDAMTEKRAYQLQRSPLEALEELRRCRAGFDPHYLEVFLEWQDALLSNGTPLKLEGESRLEDAAD